MLRAEALVDRALNAENELSNVAWRLTFAQWNLGRFDHLRRQWPRQTAIVVASIATITYLTYRLFWTMNLASAPAAIFSAALLAAEMYAGLSLGLYFFQVWRLVEPPLIQPKTLHTVDVFVATYNEDVALLRGTLSACIDMDYPHRTYVLDDGDRDEVRKLASELGVRYISRKDRSHAKAGNLNNALRQTDGEFVVVLDADHLPYRHFVSRLIGYFEDPQVGFVQVPHTTYNLDNFMGQWSSTSRAYWEDVRIFFEAVQLGKNRYGVACFCGSAAIFRRKSIEDVGLFATETITEDMHTGMRINAAGWKSLAVSEEMVVGLAPDDATTFVNQRLRWGEGNLSVMAYDNPLTMKGLSLAGRINYLASIASWTMGPARLILYLTPLIMLLTGVAPVADMSVSYFTVVGCYLITVWAAIKLASNGCGQLLSIEMAMMASFHLQLQALWRAIFHRRRQKFVVTKKNKGRISGGVSGLRRMWPQAALVVLAIVAMSWAASRVLFGLSGDYFGLLVGSGLACYHSWLALCVLGRATLKRDSDEQWHHPLCVAVDYTSATEIQQAVSVEFNENGCRLLTWQQLVVGQPLRVFFHSPVGKTICQGRVAACAPLDPHSPTVFLSNIVFEHVDPMERDRESDLLRGIILRYVVPVVTMTHRVVRQGTRALPEELSGEGDFPFPLVIDPRLPNLAVHQSVALSVNRQGFLAVLPYSCPVGTLVQASLNSPLGTITTDAEVREVEIIRVGSAIVHQHEFRWRDPAVIRGVCSKKKRWNVMLTRELARLRSHRHSTAGMVFAALIGYIIAVATVFIFNHAYQDDILLALAAQQRMTLPQRDEVKRILSRSAESPVSAEWLLRAYQAAGAIGDNELAAEAAKQLADRGGSARSRWMLTYARRLAQTKNHRAADAAFDQLLAEPTGQDAALEEQAEIYVEAARAAVAVRNYDKAVERFLQATNLKAVDPIQAEELLGVLISAKQTRLAVQVLEQLERSDRVLRRIVAVYEIAEQPQKALPELQELHRRHPDDASVTRRLAELAVLRRDFVAGVSFYHDLFLRKPSDDKIKSKLAETLLLEARDNVKAGRLDRAGSLFDESFRLQPPNDELKREYAGFLATAGHFDRAVALLEPLSDAKSRLQLAAVLEMHGKRAEALRILLNMERLLAVAPMVPGIANEPKPTAGRPGKKPHTLEQPIISNEDINKGKRSIVRLLLADHRYEDAAERIVTLLEQQPDDPLLRRDFLDAVAASEHSSEAVRRMMIDVYHRYRETDYHDLNATGLERLGDALRRLGMFVEAGDALRRAVTQYPEVRRLRFLWAQTLANLGRYEEAESQYKILLDAAALPND